MTNAQRLATATVLMTLLLITVGVIVRVTGSGLGCPDWPTCHGGVVPPNHRTAMIEFSHRFVAGLVGLMVIGVALMAWKYYRHAPAIVWTATATVPLVGLQGILGAITVWRELPPEVVATHLVTAMLVLTFEIVVAVAMYLEDPARRERFTNTAANAATRIASRRVGLFAAAALAWLVVTMWVGAYMAESGASTACEGWPLCNGGALPAADDQEVTHMLHRYLAGAFIFFVVPFVVAAWRRRDRLAWATPLAISTAVLYVVQVFVGALNVWYTFPDILAVSHTTIASGVWAALAASAAFAYYAPAGAQESVRTPSRIEVPA